MNNSFLYSMILVIIGQIPLLLKLYLDYKSKKDTYRQQLFDKQMNAYKEIYKSLDIVHRNLHGQLLLWEHEPKDESAQKHKNEVNGLCMTSLAKFSELISDHEFFLPATLVSKLAEYRHWAYKIVGAVLKMGPIVIHNWEELVSVWEKQTLLFNVLINEMRMRLGIDALSNEHTKLVTVKGKQDAIVSTYKADWYLDLEDTEFYSRK